MKLSGRPSPMLVNLLTLLMLGAAGWFALSYYDQRRAELEQLSSELEQAASLSRQIVLLRQKPDRAAAQSRSDQSLAEAVEKSADAAGVARDRVARIEPQQPRRSGDSDYLEHATVVQFDNVTLPQLASTLTTLRQGEGLEQLRVSTLRIAAPYQSAASGDAEVWNIELTLTYFVYSPKPATARKS